MGIKYLYIQTFGCQMNVHDSEQMVELMRREGYQKTDDFRKADLIIVNTCTIREKAQQKAYSLIGRFRNFKKERPDLVIGVGGCVAQQLGRDLIKQVPYIDLVFGTHNVHRLPELVHNAEIIKGPQVETSFYDKTESLNIISTPEKGAVSAYVTIMQGCNNYCAFCVVPYVRGREESRNEKDILTEIEALADHGIKEVTLLGQNVNSYGKTFKNGVSFSTLLRNIGRIGGIRRIRFTTSHPKDLTDDIIDCFGDIEALCEHIHLPVQSGSDAVLKRMNRRYTRSDYLEKVEKLRHRSPGISITSDMIVGFPGETEKDFYDTLDLMEQVRFDNLFSFKYSDRPGTQASAFVEKVQTEMMSERLIKLQAIQETYSLESNKASEGMTEEVLVEGMSKNCKDDLMGRTRTNKIVNFRGGVSLRGEIIRLKIRRAYLHSLRGDIFNKEVMRC